SIGTDSAANPDRHRRAERRPREFVIAHPLHADRPRGYLQREQGSIECDVIRAIVPIASRALRVDDDDLLGVEIQGTSERCAERKNTLRLCPDREFTRLETGDCAGRSDRCVCQRRVGISRGAIAQRGRGWWHSQFGLRINRVLSNQPFSPSHPSGKRYACPLRVCAQDFERLDRLELALAADANKVAAAKYLDDAGQTLHGKSIELNKMATQGRRTQQARM